jgi:hypothetical protein
MNIWILSADDWKQNWKPPRERGSRYDKDDKKDNTDESSDEEYDHEKEGSKDRKKRSYRQVKFPVRHYKNIKRFPLSKNDE